MKTSDKILSYLMQRGQATGKELFDHLGDITSRAVRKQLKNMLEAGVLQKLGRPPKVFYSLATNEPMQEDSQAYIEIPKSTQKIINDRYLYISASGQITYGMNGFEEWCTKTKQEVGKTASEYIKTLQKYDAYRKEELIDGMGKMRKTFSTVALDKLFYIDFYSIERFGKTKLGQMLLYAKQSQDRMLIRSLALNISPQINQLIKKYNIDGVLFIPPTVKREVQFMKELERSLNLQIRKLSVNKIKTPVIVPQKTLTKLDDRVENARNTIVVGETDTFENILLIDDAVGSGATLNETAAQIKKRNLSQGLIIGLAITGSFKGFDVISEV